MTVVQLPKFDVPEGYDAESYLRHLWSRGSSGATATAPTARRCASALNTNCASSLDGFDDYFPIVGSVRVCPPAGHLVERARSGAGSVVAYTLGITAIDPLENSLLFERFLNPGVSTCPTLTWTSRRPPRRDDRILRAEYGNRLRDHHVWDAWRVRRSVTWTHAGYPAQWWTSLHG